ncbi:hypothetical protein [Pseudonocardia sp. GCM10023141]|uniref:hypothetical protein n=1 Tax=Pseudonocardia sp. GCM10023141 TaxID=3252653 RepID=UPI00361BF08D
METFIVSGRDRAVLRAVDAGRCQLGAGCEPVLLVDGLVCADFTAGLRLVEAGLLVAPDAARPLGPARLTPAGRALLGPVPQPAPH